MDGDRHTFQRSVFFTIIGYIHLYCGLFPFIWAVIRIGAVGAGEVFATGLFYGILNYLLEFSVILLWISGIGLLRGRGWGISWGLAWAVLRLLLALVIYIYEQTSLGILAPTPDLVDKIIVFYAVSFSGIVIYRYYGTAFGNVYTRLRDRWQGRKNDDNFYSGLRRRISSGMRSSQ